MLIYATNIKIIPVPNSPHWISRSDFDEWKTRLFQTTEWETQPDHFIPMGIVANARFGKDDVAKYIDIDLPLPQGKINRELRMAIYSIREWAEVEIQVTQKPIEKDTYEALNNTSIDLRSVVQYEE